MIKKKMTLNELLLKKDLYLGLYREVRTFQRMLEVEEKVIEPLDRILKKFDKRKAELLEMKKEKPQEAEKLFKELLEEQVEFRMMKITQQEAEKLNLNPYEYREVKDLIDGKKDKKKDS